jgi:hypothetical protein
MNPTWLIEGHSDRLCNHSPARFAGDSHKARMIHAFLDGLGSYHDTGSPTEQLTPVRLLVSGIYPVSVAVHIHDVSALVPDANHRIVDSHDSGAKLPHAEARSADVAVR